MARFLLVHGSCHGAWCWRDLVPALEASGHSAAAIDLPGHGADKTAIKDITLASYRDAILEASTPKTIIVGHSMAGYPIAAAAEKAPDGMAGLIFLCAYVPADGLSMAAMRKAAPRQPLLPAIVISDDRLSYSIDPTWLETVFYQDCPAGTLEFAMKNLCPQPILPQNTAVTLSHRFASVRKSYIRCTQDQTIPPEYQQTMTRSWPAGDVHDLPTGHSPFFADPSGLAGLLDEISKEIT